MTPKERTSVLQICPQCGEHSSVKDTSQVREIADTTKRRHVCYNRHTFYTYQIDAVAFDEFLQWKNVISRSTMGRLDYLSAKLHKLAIDAKNPRVTRIAEDMRFLLQDIEKQSRIPMKVKKS